MLGGRHRKPEMEPKDLAAKFSQKSAGQAASSAVRRKAISEKEVERSKEADDCKKAVSDVVIPYLTEVQDAFPPSKFSFQITRRDAAQQPLEVTFRIGSDLKVGILVESGRVVIRRQGPEIKGPNPNVVFVYSPNAEPFISSAADLTREKLAKLIDMEIDNANWT